jgi:YesN/AraC family two-component response regulator
MDAPKRETNDSLLVIDDDPLNVQLVKAYLSDYGFKIHSSLNGRGGLDLARKEHPDLIILDVQMPIMDGFEVCTQLKAGEETRDIPVVFFSMSGDVEQKVTGFQCGAVDYITKPVQKKELIARVVNHLNFHRIRRNLENRLESYQEYYGPLPDGEISEEAGRLSRLALQRIEKVREKLVEDPENPPTLEELGEMFGVNIKRLSKEFQAVHGMTMFTWLRDYRLREAARMLRETALPVEQIAQMNGYNGGANFATAFKRRFRVSPRDYRRGKGDEEEVGKEVS